MSPAAREAVLGRLSAVLSLVFLVVLGTTVAVVAWPKLAGPGGAQAAPPEPAYQVGETFDGPAEWYSESPATLVLFAQSTCGACEKAKPYLRGLVGHLAGRSAVVMASPGPRREAEVAFADAVGIRETSVFRSPQGLRAKVTPTLVLVNRHGQVIGAWESVGPAERQAALTAAIDTALTVVAPSAR